MLTYIPRKQKPNIIPIAAGKNNSTFAPLDVKPVAIQKQLSTAISAKVRHCEALASLANKIAFVHGHDGTITAGDIMALMDFNGWRCILTNVRHSDYSPLTIEPVYPPHSSMFRHTISNYRVVYSPKEKPYYTIRRKISRELLELLEAADDSDNAEMSKSA